jgi:hypothetical protein
VFVTFRFIARATQWLEILDVERKLREVLAWFDVVYVDRESSAVLSPTLTAH